MGGQALVDVASAMFDGAGVQLYVWDAARQWLTPAAGNQLAVSDGPVPRRLGVGAAGRAAALGAPVLLDDYRSSVGNGTPAGLAGVTSAIGAPLLLGGRLLGAISVGVDGSGRALSHDELAALSALANGWPKRDQLAVLEAIYWLYRRRAIAFAVHLLHDYDAAEEVVQDVFLHVWRSGARHDAARGSLRTWVFTMVRYQAIDRVRGQRRRPTSRLTATEFQRSGGLDPAEEAARSLDQTRVCGALESLPHQQRQAIELAYFGGFSHSEIALSQQLPIGTVKGRIRLALDHLRGCLDTDLVAR